MSREDTPDASRARRPFDTRDVRGRSFRPGAVPLAKHSPRTDRSSVTEARSRCRKPAEPARDRLGLPCPGSRGRPHHTAPGRRAPEGVSPKRRPLPAGSGRPAVPTLPPRRVQVSRWRASSSGNPEQRPPAPPGSAALGAPFPGGKTFRQRAPDGHKAGPARECFQRLLRSRVALELLGLLYAAREKSVKRQDSCV